MNTSVIIGAGIVGLHMAEILRLKGHDVYVLDAAPYLGEHTSGRNSGVIHAGIFYKTGSFKEQVCIEGNRLTYEWLKTLKVNHKACGKWVIPEDGQEDELEPFFDKLKALPIPEVKLLEAEQVKKIEPHLRPTRAILVSSTGIVDAAQYIKNFAVYLENKGVQILLNCKVEGIKDNLLQTTRGEIPFELAINAAGLFCDEIAQLTGLKDYSIKPCRGDYFVMNKNPITKPVYHLPYKDAKGLGVHLTPTTDDQTIIGPNAFFIDNKTDYDPKSDIEVYKNSIKYYLPDLEIPNLTAGYAGNRPKLYKNNEPLPEFTILQKQNWVHLLGIESPGLTAAPALAKQVEKLIK
ncbi:hypothetical protein BVY03_03240 [bacterium K02(2017)]|nr:hypothetical protein BVY03_03240 [bacterium K02(2017)]